MSAAVAKAKGSHSPNATAKVKLWRWLSMGPKTEQVTDMGVAKTDYVNTRSYMVGILCTNLVFSTYVTRSEKTFTWDNIEYSFMSSKTIMFIDSSYCRLYQLNAVPISL